MQVSNMELVNSLSTGPVDHFLNNLWAICGASVDGTRTSRIVEKPRQLMHLPLADAAVFYRNASLALQEVSVCQPIKGIRRLEKIFVPGCADTKTG
ncbi:hypothetical protein [Variovorax sp. JS1663]|uniref:hypothetical protein n=1 Tax=Variovorax sp. JS1663 TaxID=1851577 RepID=UPI00117C4482|nr:hypothetical protein [Variovorax sp. JS1663]